MPKSSPFKRIAETMLDVIYKSMFSIFIVSTSFFAAAAFIITTVVKEKRIKSIQKPSLVLSVICVLAIITGNGIAALFPGYTTYDMEPGGSDFSIFTFTESQKFLIGIEYAGLILLAFLPAWMIYSIIEAARTRKQLA